MFITLTFTSRERYCKAVRFLMANADKYHFINRGRDYSAPIKAKNAECAYYVYFSKRKG